MELTNDLRSEFINALRSKPQPVYSREANLVAGTLDSEKRRIRWTLTTEDPALVYDWNSGRVVLEVLLMSGAEYEPQTPLLRDHNQYSVTAILGSVTEHSVEKDELLGWLNFGTDLDAESESIWRRVAQGHLRRGSVGYDYTRNDFVTIPAGETRVVAGRSFTAPKDRDLRVVTRWRLREFSMVVIPADARAQAREQHPRGTQENSDQESITTEHAPNANSSPQTRSSEDQMKKFLKFLHAAGLNASVKSTEEALTWARSGNLSADQITELASLCKEDGVEFDPASATAKRAATTGTRGATGTESNTNTGNETTEANRGVSTPANNTNGAPDTAAIQRAAQDAIQAERNRIAAIRELHEQHPGVPAAVARQAEADGWDLARTTNEFLTALRGSREPGVPNIIVGRGRHNLSLAVITAALLGRTDLGIDSGITPDSPVFRSSVINTMGRRREFQAGWMVNVPQAGERRDQFEQTFERAGQLGLNNLSFMRAAELILELETGERHFDESEILERAFSSGGFSAVFGAVVHMQLLASYAATQSAYTEFCDVVEVGDFREHKDADMGQVGRLKKQAKSGNGQAAILNVDDPQLVSILVERYAGLLKVTDQTIIQDSLGVVGMLPAELGATCAQMPADLAFAQVLRSDNLGDGRARYNTTDGNLITASAFDQAALTALGVALTAKKIGDRRIQVNGSTLLSGATQGPTVRRQMNSQYTAQNEVNPHFGTYRAVQDTAVDLGVLDPAAGDVAVAGTPNSIYAFAAGNKRSVAVAFRRGTNRGPVTRSGMLTQGEWGMYWDVFMDVGAAFRRRVGTVRVNIA
jgi:hypothetical protein